MHSSFNRKSFLNLLGHHKEVDVLEGGYAEENGSQRLPPINALAAFQEGFGIIQ